jgi:hypothetical protein
MASSGTRTIAARVSQVSLGPDGRTAAWIECPGKSVPAPGQYCLSVASGDVQAVLPVVLFACQVSPHGFLAAPPIPLAWAPGVSLRLRGPLGRGFSLPANTGRLALAALGATAMRLLPLAQQAATEGVDIAWFTDAPLPILPAAQEINPLNALPSALAWADFLALEVAMESLPGLRGFLGLRPEQALPCPAQALVLAPMPCGGMAECGVCAIPVRRGYKLVCQDGPVFELEELISSF